MVAEVLSGREEIAEIGKHLHTADVDPSLLEPPAVKRRAFRDVAEQSPELVALERRHDPGRNMGSQPGPQRHVRADQHVVENLSDSGEHAPGWAR